MEIISQRLVLKPISMEYKQNIFEEFTPGITVFMWPNPPKKIEDTEEFIISSIQKREKGEEVVFVVMQKETNEFMGCAGLHNMHTKTPELGIWIKTSGQGHGYGKEAIEAIKKWADENVDYEYILYPVGKDNLASRKIPESMGGKVVREFIGEKQDGTSLEEVEYRIYKN